MAPDAIEAREHRQYSYHVVPDSEGGYVVDYPDLPGCITQVETVDQVGNAASEILDLWMEAADESGYAIPEPSHTETHSGKFLLRLPKSLHRRLAERAAGEGVSLNQLAVALIAEGIGREAHARSFVDSLQAGSQFAPTRPPSSTVAENSADYDDHSDAREKQE